MYEILENPNNGTQSIWLIRVFFKDKNGIDQSFNQQIYVNTLLSNDLINGFLNYYAKNYESQFNNNLNQ